ncbi:ArsR/SmtB family transcription factor [Haliovirga abyssi]|uniref:Transcriptional regulator n=1 Tax=Haliovirga abyssi TaxID=2996794 RepID=A0AAU9D8M7_9FUSO|nr:metalloregulator ArsR/SmtB family transcription factor [Haliovirga abyssi]BDU50958.1 transcriptional regulator [Haliovirga abyssi]
MKEEIITKMFKALGHPLRYKIVKLLSEEPKCVCEIEPELDFSKPNLSQHLKILKEAGIIIGKKRGLNIYYRIKNSEMKRIIKLGENFYAEYIKDLKGEEE